MTVLSRAESAVHRAARRRCRRTSRKGDISDYPLSFGVRQSSRGLRRNQRPERHRVPGHISCAHAVPIARLSGPRPFDRMIASLVNSSINMLRFLTCLQSQAAKATRRWSSRRIFWGSRQAAVRPDNSLCMMWRRMALQRSACDGRRSASSQGDRLRSVSSA